MLPERARYISKAKAGMHMSSAINRPRWILKMFLGSPATSGDFSPKLLLSYSTVSTGERGSEINHDPMRMRQRRSNGSLQDSWGGTGFSVARRWRTGARGLRVSDGHAPPNTAQVCREHHAGSHLQCHAQHLSRFT